MQLKIKGKRHWLWRAVDKHGVVLDILVQQWRDQHYKAPHRLDSPNGQATCKKP